MQLQRALLRAARRGVKITLLLQGRYEYFMQYYASRPVYAQLMQAGVEIHEYAASFLHAKVAVADGQWATVGSSNIDPFSLLLARKLYALSQTNLPPSFWLNVLTTLLLLLGQSVQDSASGKDVVSAFSVRMALFIAVTLFLPNGIVGLFRKASEKKS